MPWCHIILLDEKHSPYQFSLSTQVCNCVSVNCKANLLTKYYALDNYSMDWWTSYLAEILLYRKRPLISSPPPAYKTPVIGPSTCTQKIHLVISPPLVFLVSLILSTLTVLTLRRWTLSFCFVTFRLHSCCYSFDFVVKIDMNSIYYDISNVN